MSQTRPDLSRRKLFAGAGTVGALAAVASLVPGTADVAPPANQQAKPAPAKGGGYTLSAHVKQYYKTTLV